MYSPGFFPNGYLGKPFNGGYYLVQALAQRYGFDPATTPWNEMAPEAQQAFLFGTTELLDVTAESRTGRINHLPVGFPGFLRLYPRLGRGRHLHRYRALPGVPGRQAAQRVPGGHAAGATTFTSSAR